MLKLEEALKLAHNAGLDLIEIAPTANPPVAKIMNRGKYIYEQEKKERVAAKHRKEVEIKSVRIGIGTSMHDLEMKAKQADGFLRDGNKIKVDLSLRGREKYLDKLFLEKRIERFLQLISSPIETGQIKKGPRGLNVMAEPKRK